MATEFALGLDRLLEVGEDLRGFYIGKVVDDGASDSMGRIKVRIESLFGAEADKAKIADDALPWIQMMPSCGLYVRPQKEDFVTVVFQGSIYEGFYVGHAVNMQSKSKNEDGGTFGGKLKDEFFFNFHKSFMRGKYDGSEFELNVNKNTTVKIDGEGNVEIVNKGDTKIETTGKSDIKVKGNVSLESSGNIEVKSTGKVEVKSTGNMSLQSNGNVEVQSALNMTLSPSMMFKLNKTMPAIPGAGPLNCLPVCPIIGIQHGGNTVA